MLCRDLGPPDSSILLVGEAPGESEERAGVPFCGAAGKMLKQMLSHVGIDFNTCYVTNVVNSRPPSNNFSHFYDTKLLSDSIDILRNKIESIQPKVVILLGKEALKAVCNKSEISQYRGTWLSFRNINVLPTFHPSYVLHQYQDHVIVEMDLQKAISQKPQMQPPMILSPTLKQVLQWIENVIIQGCRVAFDIETVGKHIRCLALASDVTTQEKAICIPFIKFASSSMTKVGDKIVTLTGESGTTHSYWSPSNEVCVLNAIDRLFNSGIEIVGQNSICFDEPLLLDEFGLSIKNHYLDTMHAWHCIRKGTRIRTVNRGFVLIEDVVEGDIVWGWKNDTCIPVKVKMAGLTRHHASLVRVNYWYLSMYYQTINADYIDVTPDHRFRLRDETWVAAKDLQSGQVLTRLKQFIDQSDTIYDARVATVVSLDSTDSVYDIAVDDDCLCFTANDIVVHNCLYSELPMGLSFLCSALTNYSNYWTEKDTQDDLSEWRYNAMDAVVTLDVSYKIEDELREVIVK